MTRVLLDTHTLYWLVTEEEPMTDEALIAIGEAQQAGTLYVSPVTAWELSLASRKPARKNPTRLNTTISEWFRTAVRDTSAKVVPIGHRIAIEAAEVPVATGHKDPGDCYLIATARVRRMPIITRDGVMEELAATGYMSIIKC